MSQEAHDARHCAQGDLEDALRVIASMACRTREAQAKFSPGTSQHTLLRNRLNALQKAEALVQAELDES